jgi:exopolyphosphatase / guanosine-5'-triphosphate,3'-diphosphate pyrophosphatase
VTLQRRRGRSWRAPVGAAIDLGSNSVHLLVAAVHGHRLEPLLDTSEFLGLGRAVDEGAALGPELIAGLVATLASYVEGARALGAGPIVILGTDPLRRATDAAVATVAIEARTAAAVDVIDHEEEALLTLLGVTAGRPVVRELVVVDIGGGSSEVLAVGPDR